MSSSAKRFAIGFAGGTVTAVFVNLLPFFRTRRAYKWDGFELVGFPFTFRRLGGFTGIDEFRATALIADISLTMVVALFAGYACTRLRQGN